MTKLKKTLVSALAVSTIASCSSMCAFAEDSFIMWELKYNDRNTVTCYEDGTIERNSIRFAKIIVTVPEDVTPDLEYFGVERIEDVIKFEKTTNYRENAYGYETWTEIAPMDNEYLLDIRFKDMQNIPELEEECREIAKNLLSQGKIESARTYDIYSKYTMNSIGGINITTDGSVDTLNLEDFSELADSIDKNSDNQFALNKYADDKETIVNIMDMCSSLVDKYDYIVSAEPIFPQKPVSSSTESMYVTDYIYMWGDTDKNNVIDIYDAVEIAKHVMNLNELDEDTVLLADINRDGETNLYDAIEISKTLMA